MTWEPRYTVQKAPGIGGDPIPADEPCLVIRAQDVLAVPMLRQYLVLYSVQSPPPFDTDVVRDLEGHLAALEKWQADNFSKVKWADR